MKLIIISKADKKEISIYVEKINIMDAYTQVEVSSINDVKKIISYCNDNTIVRMKGYNYIILVPNNETVAFREIQNSEADYYKLLVFEISNAIGEATEKNNVKYKNGTFVIQNQFENIMLPFKLKFTEEYDQNKNTYIFFASIYVTNENFQSKKLFTNFDYTSIIKDIADFIVAVAATFAKTENNKIQIFNLPKEFIK